MTDSVIRCGDCKHFRRDKELWWVMLIPIVGQLLAPMIIKGSYRFGRCMRKKASPQMDPAFTNEGTAASVAREYDCGTRAHFFERRTPFFLRAVAKIGRVWDALHDWLRSYPLTMLWTLGAPIQSVTPDTPTDDELRVAYEYVTCGGAHRIGKPADWYLCLSVNRAPTSVRATLRKLEAA
jgi:hypothetical protein